MMCGMQMSRILLAASAAAIGSLTLVVPAAAHPDRAAGPGGDWNDTVYLTFDDGPNGDDTDRVLEVLADNDARATFFAVGQSLEDDPARGLRIMAEGHVLANHTWSHPDLTELSRAEVDWEIASAAWMLDDLGSGAPCFRPPYGSSNAEVDDAIADAGLNKLMWNVDTEDWRRPGVDAIADVLLGAAPGDVVLMHDGGGDRSQTVEALEIALPRLAERGYRFGIAPECVIG